MLNRRLLVLGWLITVIFAAQEAPEPSLTITGDVPHPLTLTAADLARMPRASVRTAANGMETVYEGVRLHVILGKAGAPQARNLRGKALTNYVLVSARDGYQVLFSLAELDTTFTGSEVLLADTANGKPLFGAMGRFRLIVPKDLPGARSVRMLERIEVVQLRK